jgi:hypothetical protein
LKRADVQAQLKRQRFYTKSLLYKASPQFLMAQQMRTHTGKTVVTVELAREVKGKERGGMKNGTSDA